MIEIWKYCINYIRSFEILPETLENMPPKTVRIVAEGMPAAQSRSSLVVITSIPDVPVTQERRPFVQPDDDQRLPHTGRTP